MLILAFETSCDETAVALVKAKGGLSRPTFNILHQEILSQIKLHRPYGGVVPTLAKREHAKNLPLLLKRLIRKVDISTIDLIAVTVGPGLEPALWEGINFASGLASLWNKPLVGINHLEGHIFSNWFNKRPNLPAVCLIVSGGHTILILMNNLTEWKVLGSTRDDAVGEAFDKVARLLKLPYPGGPEIEKNAKKGKPIINFPRPMLHAKNYDFSYSGLKTSVLYYYRNHPNVSPADLSASFQTAAFEPLVKKAIRAACEKKAKSILLCGGVASNQFLRHWLASETKKNNLSFFAPPTVLNTDNAAMIAAAAYLNYLNKKHLPLPLEANGHLSI